MTLYLVKYNVRKTGAIGKPVMMMANVHANSKSEALDKFREEFSGYDFVNPVEVREIDTEKE